MWRKIFIAAFGLLTIAPALQMASNLVPESPVIENRKLAPAPNSTDHPHKIVRDANRWFEDHFGLRSLLIRLKTQIDFSVFKASDRVHIGPDGWLFYRSVLDVQKPSLERELANIEPDVLAGLREFTAALKRNGIQPIILVNILGDRYYPDKVPSSAPPAPSGPRIDHLVQQIKSIESLSFVDTNQILSDVAKGRLAFHKTDFHWNDPAAFPVAEEIVRLASEAEGKPSVWRHRLEISTKRFSGGVASFMPLFAPPSEQGLFVRRNWTMPKGVTEVSNRGVFESVMAVPQPDPHLSLGPVVILGDSFSDAFIRAGMYLYFSELYRSRWGQVTRISSVVNELPPDTKHFVIQFIEVQRAALLAFANKEDIAEAVAILDSRSSPEDQ